ncbi:hypothetical protein AVW16_13000 [Crenobacter luteus]|uniref:Flagella basal body P-ring formation protein FlgA n=2 Tax=Crenobacter luteus TaxID=1452487 RepID=A0A165F215_9NEIS|nr:hypothetical protein AVW16_13000 [Crenobacter luteus]
MDAMKTSRLLAATLSCAFAVPALASGGWAALDAPVRAFLDAELAPRGVSYQLRRPAGRLALPACAAPQLSWPAGAAQSGNTFVEVGCAAAGWQLRYPVSIGEARVGVVTTRRIQAGETLSAADLKLAPLPNPALGGQVLDAPEAAVGQVVKSGLPEGAWLRRFMLVAPIVVRSNQPVLVRAQSDGFVVSAQGKALGNAAAGDEVSVRMPSGRQVRGRVQADGSVRLPF